MFPLNIEIVYDTGRLIKAPVRVQKLTDFLTKKAAYDIQDAARLNVVDRGLIKSGDLFNNILVEETENGFLVYVNVPYAHFHEYGTVRMPARPFFWPAVDEVVRRLFRDIARIYEAELTRQ